ncbi:4'-phosphopantetheinyl transferase family protein [Tropicimonas aquimaris]
MSFRRCELEEFWTRLRTPEHHAGPLAMVLSLGMPTEDAFPEASLLCPAETRRHQRMREPTSAWAYLCSHVALRILAGWALGRSPAALEFVSPGEPNVPPRLRGEAQSGLQVSLSHSGSSAAIGLRQGGMVGIDVEQTDRARDALAVVENFLTPNEVGEVLALPRHDQGPLALRYWCAKEAVLKAAGTGLSTDPRSVSVQWSGEIATTMLDGVAYELGRIGPHFPERTAGAIACSAPVGEIMETHSSFNELLSLFRTSQPWWMPASS